MPWGMGDLAANLGFERIIELQWWESFSHGDWKVTLTPSQALGRAGAAGQSSGLRRFLDRTSRPADLSRRGQRLFFRLSRKLAGLSPPEIAMLPIGAYYPDSFRRVHMGPDEAVKAFARSCGQNGWCRCTTAPLSFV